MGLKDPLARSTYLKFDSVDESPPTFGFTAACPDKGTRTYSWTLSCGADEILRTPDPSHMDTSRRNIDQTDIFFEE